MTLSIQTPSDWCELAERLSSDFDLSATARRYGAFERVRSVRSAEDLLRLALVYGTTPLSLRATAGWAAAQGLCTLSDVALLYRLQGCDSWLSALVSGLLTRAVGPLASSPALDRRVRLIDGTVISGPGAQQGHWRLHADYDLGQRRFIGFDLSDRQGSESLERFLPEAGDLFVGDRYYAKADQLAHVVDHGADFLVRRGLTSCRLQHADGQALDTGEILMSLQGEQGLELPVLVPLPNKPGREALKARLIFRHIGQDQLAEARRRVRRQAAKSGRKPSAKSLKAAEYVILMTSLPDQQLCADQALRIYRLRWQIELAFKRLKSLMGLGDLLAKDHKLVRSCLYAKIILALVTEDISSNVLDSPPSEPAIAPTLDLAPSIDDLHAAHRHHHRAVPD